VPNRAWRFESSLPHGSKGCEVHDRATVSRAVALHGEGLGAREIAQQMGLPFGTVRDWLAGRLPKHSCHPDPAALSICERCGQPAHDFSGLPSTYMYLLGLYLGDGCISLAHRGVFRLRIALDTRYPGIIDSAASAIVQVRGGKSHIQSGPGNWVEVSGYWKSWPCLFPQHGPGSQHERAIALAPWQLELVERWPDQILRGLIHSDGCRFQNTGRRGWSWPRYSFVQASDDIRAIFCHACDLIGVHWTPSGSRTIYVSRKADVARLDEFIGPKH
jgi:hypothetical protein